MTAVCSDPFNRLLGDARGQKLPPRLPRLDETAVDGWALFSSLPPATTDNSDPVTYADARQALLNRTLVLTGAVRYKVLHDLRVSSQELLACLLGVAEPLALQLIERGTGTCAPTELLPAHAQRNDASPSYTTDDALANIFNAYCYHGCVRLHTDDGDELLLSFQPQGTVLRGFPTVSPQLPDLAVDLSEFYGCFADGYTDDDINRTLPQLENALGVSLVCLWEARGDDGWFEGHSEILIVDPQGRGLRSLNDDFMLLLLGDDDTTAKFINPRDTPEEIMYVPGQFYEEDGANYLPL